MKQLKSLAMACASFLVLPASADGVGKGEWVRVENAPSYLQRTVTFVASRHEQRHFRPYPDGRFFAGRDGSASALELQVDSVDLAQLRGD